jgi:3-deoxy-D-manno-octulosonic-acid transferase
MNPDRLLRNMCIRHGISPGEVRSLVPVIRKALEAPAWVRDRILSIVEGNLAERSEEQADEEALAQDLDRELLFAVAAMLHGWEPKNEMRDLYGNADEPPAA